MKLRVFADGQAPREAELTHLLKMQWMSRVQPGQWLQVAVDRQPPYDVPLDEEALQRPPPSPPSTP